MSVRSWVREHLGGKPAGESPTDGMPEDGAGDERSTTGTGSDETFVGRVAGDDPGYLETGAEERGEPDAGTDDPGG